MKKLLLILVLVGLTTLGFSQNKPNLTVEKIMQNPTTWIGTSPSSVFWSEDGKTIYFDWNPENNAADSLYKVSAPWTTPVKVSMTEQKKMPSRRGEYNRAKSLKLYDREGDLYIYDVKKGTEKRLTQTESRESSPSFSQDEKSVVFTSNNNLFKMDLASGFITQITNFSSGNGNNRRGNSEKSTERDQALEESQLELFSILKNEKELKNASKEFNDKFQSKPLKEISAGGGFVASMMLSPDENFVVFLSFERSSDKNTIVPDYVTESGYTEDLNARSKVGGVQGRRTVSIYDRKSEQVYEVNSAELPDLDKAPEYYSEYDRKFEGKKKLNTFLPVWSLDGKKAVISLTTDDNKDRYIALLNLNDGNLTLLDHQHDEAWIGGPGIGGWGFSGGDMGWLPDNKHIYFQSEVSGYSHLYLMNVETKERKALTSGNYEVYSPQLNKDKTAWFFEANIEHPGISQAYTMPLMGGKITPLTDMGGKADVTFSPDFTKMAILHSTANHPEELYVSEKISKPENIKKITNSTTAEWESYPWRTPQFITFEARDGANVYARLYEPENNVKNNAAVVFVHGAGYLQNAHQWWSTYFREYMFHNLLVEKGYTVIDIDYRGSSGYGRDWRTGIYRHMGGKDLTDQVDGVNYLIKEKGIDKNKIGIYGGSYGGFITLMAMFTEADSFTSGAALRSVTDWAHYNHGYTSNILNTPTLDSIAYRRSSPIYFAEGLKGNLLICHGMVDTNVHFQDVVRLSQRLIELGKDNWEMAVFPKENHGFVHPSSWTDEYKRILKLFEETLK